VREFSQKAIMLQHLSSRRWPCKIIFVLVVAGSLATTAFAAQSSFTIGFKMCGIKAASMNPQSFAAGYLNGDNKPDFVYTNYASDTISVLMNNGDGTFAPKIDYAVGTEPVSAALRDVNGDGKSDVVVANYGSDTFSVLMNNGDGTFAAKVDYSTGSKPDAIVVGDVDGDGKSDIVVANYGSNTVSVFKNNSNGTFTRMADYGTGDQPASIALGDVNADGKADIVAANWSSDTVSVFINSGLGVFVPKVDYAAGYQPAAVSLADLNGDNKLDIVVTNHCSDSVSVFLNNGDGTFAPKVSYTTGPYPEGVAVGDLNGDGKPDIVVANHGSNTISVFLNNGDGTFASKVDYVVDPDVVILIDMNDDGRIDTVSASEEVSSPISVLVSNGNGTFEPRVDYSKLGTTPAPAPTPPPSEVPLGNGPMQAGKPAQVAPVVTGVLGAYASNVSDVQISNREKVVAISWNNPSDTAFDSVRVVRSYLFYPTDLVDGKVVYEGRNDNFNDTSAEAGTTYYYTIFAKDSNGNYSSGAIAKVTTLPLPAVRAAIAVPPPVVKKAPVFAVSLSDFTFMQDGKKINIVGLTIPVTANLPFLIILPYEKMPETARTIIATIDTGVGNVPASVLFQPNDALKVYEAVVQPPAKSGEITITFFDYAHNEIGNLKGNLSVAVPGVSMVTPELFRIKIVPTFLLIIFLFIIFRTFFAVGLI
jgi:hypothetical protein